MTPGTRRLIAIGAAVAGALMAPVAYAGPARPGQPPLPPGQPRLQGAFAMTGRITAAVNIPGERAGQSVSRTWVFTPKCAAGACAQVLLGRTRGPGLPPINVLLTFQSPGFYTARGTFYAPLRCAGRTHRPGERVQYRVGVRITATATVNGQLVVTAMRASYTSGRRDNLTRCVAPIGQRDSAQYTGQPAS